LLGGEAIAIYFNVKCIRSFRIGPFSNSVEERYIGGLANLSMPE
jgi:hypothetical protein